MAMRAVTASARQALEQRDKMPRMQQNCPEGTDLSE